MTEPTRKMDTYGPEDMTIPTWTLIQSVGGDNAKSLGAKPGQFFCSLDDSIVDELKIVVVDIVATRTYWGRNEIEDSPPDCASLNAKSMRSTTGEDCSNCPRRLDAPWLLKPQERRQMCNMSYVIMGINTADFMPLIIRAGGISAMPVRLLLTQLKLNRKLKGEIHRAIISFSAAKKKTAAGEAYALHPKIVELVTDESIAEEFKNESLQLLGAPIALPEARPEEEPEPLGFTPDGIPFYSEEERDILARSAVSAPNLLPARTIEKTVLVKKPEKKEPPKGETGENLDLDF